MCTRCVPNICWGSDLMASALSGSHSCWRDMLLLHWVWPQKSRLVWVYIWVCRWFHCCHFSTFGEIFLRNVIVIVFDDSLSFSSHWSAVVLPVIKLSFCSHCHLVFCSFWLKLQSHWHSLEALALWFAMAQRLPAPLQIPPWDVYRLEQLLTQLNGELQLLQRAPQLKHTETMALFQ